MLCDISPSSGADDLYDLFITFNLALHPSPLLSVRKSFNNIEIVSSRLKIDSIIGRNM